MVKKSTKKKQEKSLTATNNELLDGIRYSAKYKEYLNSVHLKHNHSCFLCGRFVGEYKKTTERYGLHVHRAIPLSILVRAYNIKTFEEALKDDRLWNIEHGIPICLTCKNYDNLRKAPNPQAN